MCESKPVPVDLKVCRLAVLESVMETVDSSADILCGKQEDLESSCDNRALHDRGIKLGHGRVSLSRFILRMIAACSYNS